MSPGDLHGGGERLGDTVMTEHPVRKRRRGNRLLPRLEQVLPSLVALGITYLQPRGHWHGYHEPGLEKSGYSCRPVVPR